MLHAADIIRSRMLVNGQLEALRALAKVARNAPAWAWSWVTTQLRLMNIEELWARGTVRPYTLSLADATHKLYSRSHVHYVTMTPHAGLGLFTPRDSRDDDLLWYLGEVLICGMYAHWKLYQELGCLDVYAWGTRARHAAVTRAVHAVRGVYVILVVLTCAAFANDYSATAPRCERRHREETEQLIPRWKSAVRLCLRAKRRATAKSRAKGRPPTRRECEVEYGSCYWEQATRDAVYDNLGVTLAAPTNHWPPFQTSILSDLVFRR